MTASQCPDKNLTSTQCILLLSLKAVQKVFATALKSSTASAGVSGASSLHTESPLPRYSHFQLTWQQSQCQCKLTNSRKARVSILRCLFRIVLSSFTTSPHQIYLKFHFAPGCHLNSHLTEPKARALRHRGAFQLPSDGFLHREKALNCQFSCPISPQRTTTK